MIKKSSVKDIYSLSPLQTGILFHYLKDEHSNAYKEQLMITIYGDIDLDLFEKSFNRIIEKYDILRTNFLYKKVKMPQQVVLRVRDAKIHFEDISYLPEEDKITHVEQYGKEDKKRGFRLSRDLLLRMAVFKTSQQRYQVLLSFYHIIMDGWCIGIIFKDMTQVYQSLRKGVSVQLEPEIPYSTYIKWLEKQDKEEGLWFWKEYLEGYGQKASVPLLTIPKNGHEYRVEEYSLILDDPLSKSLIQMARENQVTLNVVFQTIWGIVLQKYNNTYDVVFGVIVSGRTSEINGVEKMVGLFMNNIPIRIKSQTRQTFSQLIRNLHQTSISIKKYEYLSLAEIQSCSLLKGELVDHILVFENYPVQTMVTDVSNRNEVDLGLSVADVKTNNQSHYDFNIAVVPGNQILVKFSFNSLVYHTDFIDKIASHIKGVITQVVTNPHVKVIDIELLTPQEKMQVLDVFNNSSVPYPGDKLIHQLFEEQVQQCPDTIALVFQDEQLTYRELNRKANQLARMLRSKGVIPDSIVGIMVHRSMDMMVSILGILKAGGAYLPIDPETPTRRIVSMMEDCGASLLVTKIDALADHPFSDLQNLELKQMVVQLSAPRPSIKNFDSLPIPDRSLVNYEKYNQYIGHTLVQHCISLQATRGCPYNCAYCHKIWPKTHVVRSAQQVFEEVKRLYDLGIRRFNFVDDIFNLNVKNSRRFFELVIENGLKVQFLFMLRGDIITEEYIDLMIKARTIRIAVALETASPRLQKLIGKNIHIEKLYKNTQYIANKYPEVILDLYTMHGFPTETEEEARMTLDFIKGIKRLHFPYIFVLRIYPNTEMERLALKSGISKEAIARSLNSAFHELPETLPFKKSFSLKYQNEFLYDYFLSKKRLLEVLPYQMKVLTESELVQKYNSYLPADIRHFDDLLQFLNISREELDAEGFLDEREVAVPGLNAKLKAAFPAKQPDEKAFRILLLDLSQNFTHESNLLQDLVEAPLGLMALLTYLNQQLGSRINGKIAKAMIDFDNYAELKQLLVSFKPDLIGIRTLTYYKEFFHRTVSVIRQYGMDVPIIAGGPYATSSYDTILQDRNIDVVVLGEGEITFYQLVQKIMEHNGTLPPENVLNEIKGITYVPKTEKMRKQNRFSREIILLDHLAGALEKEVGENLDHVNRPMDLVYTIFTSGSTGNPKGALLQHKNLHNLLVGLTERIYGKYGENLRVCMISPYVFDGSVKQIFGALLQGHTLYVVPENIRVDSIGLLEFYQKYGIEISDGTPTHLRLLLDAMGESKAVPEVRHFIIGGEILSRKVVEQLLAAFGSRVPALTNVYGPTECCVDSTSYDVIKSHLTAIESIPIGCSMPNQQVYILDKQNKPQPVGIPGELCIAGDGLARGYVNNPELTAQKFPSHQRWQPIRNSKSLVAEGKIYKTGDMARWLSDGNLEFLDRADRQIKVRGVRMELGDIENQLLKHENIRESVVVVRRDENGEEYLCAYITLSTTSKGVALQFEVSRLREFLSKLLPIYMIPSYFVPTEKIPLTSNGKVDTDALPEPEVEDVGEYEAPRNDMEMIIVDIWQEVLGIKRIGITDNFFDLGGDSIKAIQISARLRKRNLKLELGQLFRSQTIKNLVDSIQTLDHTHTRFIHQQTVEGEVDLTPIQRWFFQKNFTHSHHFNQSVMLYKKDGFDETILRKVFTKIVQHHDALRMVFEKEDGNVIQRNRGPEGKLFDLKVIHIKVNAMDGNGSEAEIEIEREATNIQADINLQTGPLVKLGLFKTNNGDHLLIVIHHLVVDGISWRIFLEDFSVGCTQAERGAEIKFPGKTDSFQSWASALTSYSQSHRAQKELSFWKAVEETTIEPLPRDYDVPKEMKINRYVESVVIHLNEADTDTLLKDVNRTYNTEMNVILLTALAKALKDWAGLSKMVIDLEGHGREDIIEDIDVSRTVGWYTSHYPLVVDMSQSQDLSLPDEITRVKESLRKIPNKGIGYGILKYLTPMEKKEDTVFEFEPEIRFNYLGQFGQEVSREKNSQALVWEYSGMKMGRTSSLQLERPNAIDINCMVVNGKLSFSFAYNKNEYKRTTMEALAASYKSMLKEIIAHCTTKQQGDLTPADVGFGFSEISIEDLQTIKSIVKEKF
jgi:amino acid adenylation domain-containing protein/non-ribosomal peptide synthase protein (TIGR01720 family)